MIKRIYMRTNYALYRALGYNDNLFLITRAAIAVTAMVAVAASIVIVATNF